MRFRDTLDGLANTIAAGEITTDLGDRDTRTRGRRQGNWWFGTNLAQARTDQTDPERPQFWSPTATGVWGGAVEGRGYQWSSGFMVFSQMNTIFPPNAPVVSADWINSPGIFPPSSRHQGGAHILMGDGAVKFVTDSIEAGDQTKSIVRNNNFFTAPGSKSPFGLWGALGTRANKEVIEEEL